MLTLIDEHTRECLAIDVARRLNSEEMLERLTKCTELEQLNVDDTGVTEQGLADFQAALPSCRLN